MLHDVTKHFIIWTSNTTVKVINNEIKRNNSSPIHRKKMSLQISEILQIQDIKCKETIKQAAGRGTPPHFDKKSGLKDSYQFEHVKKRLEGKEQN